MVKIPELYYYVKYYINRYVICYMLYVICIVRISYLCLYVK